MPHPTSNTGHGFSDVPPPSESHILRAILRSTRKCWPNAFFALTHSFVSVEYLSRSLYPGLFRHRADLLRLCRRRPLRAYRPAPPGADALFGRLSETSYPSPNTVGCGTRTRSIPLRPQKRPEAASVGRHIFLHRTGSRPTTPLCPDLPAAESFGLAFRTHNHQRYFFTSSTCLRGFL